MWPKRNVPRLFIQNIQQKKRLPLHCRANCWELQMPGALNMGEPPRSLQVGWRCFFRGKKNPMGNPKGAHHTPMAVGCLSWWQLKHFFKCSSRKFGEDEPNLTIIFFEMGWFNHQTVVNNPLIKAGYFLGALGRYP